MRHAVTAALVSLSLATPAAAQGVQQLLQGLTSGNKNQDDAVRQAYERGYQKGRQDEARLRSGGGSAPDYRNGQGGGQGYGRPPQGQDDGDSR